MKSHRQEVISPDTQLYPSVSIYIIETVIVTVIGGGIAVVVVTLIFFLRYEECVTVADT